MPKSLGQIHTVSHEFANIDYSLASGNQLLIDLPGELTKQLQHMVRMMSSFKVVGIDMAIGPVVGGSNLTASMSGQVQYYTPTKGRVDACKAAYHSVRRMMKLSGIDPTHAITYDFRPLIADPADFENGTDIPNWASIEDNGLASCLANGPALSNNIFGVYNQGILPRQAIGSAPNFEDGFAIGLRSNVSSADFTLNEAVVLKALTTPTASEELETIPFELSYSPPDTVGGINMNANVNVMQWRPDPALYLSVLTGQLIIDIESFTAVNDEGVADPDEAQLDVSVHVAGWKGILSDRKHRRRSKKKAKSHGRKRRSKK